MKKLIFINGTMGVGKTTTSNELKKLLEPSVFLDGDWCWDMNPFIVTDETKSMVTENITYLLNNYLRCSEFEYIIFCWVMHRQEIIDEILEGLDCESYKKYCITLTCSKEVLKDRLCKDIEAGRRKEEIIQRSLSRVKQYDDMTTKKLDVSHLTAHEAALNIEKIIRGNIYGDSEN